MSFLLDNDSQMLYNKNMIYVKSRRKGNLNADWIVDQVYADGLPGWEERQKQFIDNAENREDSEYEYKVEVK
jgi:hypothetical protein|tara:strand:+ start:605 stop:820 length:216 start_codon:yes stop_codon:yes gene_type:complete